jgi:CHAT domain-containing protein
LESRSDGHLSVLELSQLCEVTRQPSVPGKEAAELHPHLAACPACRERFQKQVAFDRQLENLRPEKPGPRQADCPEPAVWPAIAVGETPTEQALTHIRHASGCVHCGPLLREAVADLNEETTTAETKQIAALESARPEWQRRLAQRITGTSAPDRTATPSYQWARWMTVPRLATAAAGLMALAIFGWFALQPSPAEQAGRLLARAYTEQRTLELRIAGARQAPPRVERGPETSFASRPEALLDAEALIAGQLASHPSDSYWLQAKGRADLLEGKYDGAVDSLRRALQLTPDSTGIMTDLASAYFQRALTANRPEDFGTAFEYLSKVLAKQPDDPVALFNRAIVSEHQFLYHQALDDWEHYLRVDARSEWADEARKRADEVRKKLKKHDESHAAPLLTPAQVVAQANSVNLRADMDPRVEEYLHDAVRSWLPQAYPEPGAASDPSAAQALFFLADLTAQQHGDRWLSDLLAGSSSPNFPQAVGALAHAVKGNDAGEYDTTNDQASQAERLFQASGNVAGVLHARFEQILAAQMTRRSESCRQHANTALAESWKYPYAWLHVQLQLEKGVCSFLMGDIGADESATGRAEELAQKSVYRALYLRAVSFAAADKLSTGDQSGASKLAGAALQSFWAGQFPAMRAYNLYLLDSDIAQAADWPNLQMATWREATALIDSGENMLLRAWAHNSMANAATAARQPEVAELQYAEAARLFALAPRTEASRNYAIDTGIRLARLEARFGRFDAAIVRLTSIQNQVRPLSNNYLAQMFYSTLGELQLGRHREPEAEQALRPALALAEQSLATLRSEAERTSWSKDAAPAYLALIEAELAQQRPQDALEMYEWYLGAPQRLVVVPHPNRFLTNPPMPDPPRLEPRLPLLAKETVVAYAALPDGLAIWVYDDRGVNARWIPKQTEDLRDLAARFHDLSSDPKSEMSALRRDAHSLYGALIAPVEQYFVPGRSLVIEAEGWLASVPFEALLDSNDRYLVERAPIVHSLGQDSQARLREDTGISADLPALVVASTASSPAGGRIPLPDVAAEADTVASGFHSASVLKGGEATFNAVWSALPAARVFHFAGHSLSTPDKAGLMLISGEVHSDIPLVLDADALRRLQLPTMQLAVLSACSTAAGSGGSGGFNSVTEALLRAGVPHVVASRWAVDSGEARAFVEDFYDNALSGLSVSDAIRLTSRKMLSNPRTAHPYYWSAFAAYGRP